MTCNEGSHDVQLRSHDSHVTCSDGYNLLKGCGVRYGWRVPVRV